ncbi:MAG: ABC transporter ATP-binding protein [Clostridia bacterium]|nr:ABC transporter ATP-binding protein [Clostridia bacterium]
MKHLWGYLKNCRRAICVGTVIKVIGTMMDLLIPYILAHILNDVVERKEVTPLVFWGLVMVLCAVMAVLFNVLANRMASLVACDCTREIRHDLFARISYLSSEQTDRLTIASLESRLTSDTYNVNHMIGMMLRLGIRAPILLFGGIIMTMTLDWRLTLVLILTLPFLFVVVSITSKVGIPLYKKLQAKNDEVTRVVREDAAGVRVIKALSKTEYEKKRFDNANTDAIAMEKKAGVTMAKINPIMTFVLNAGMCAVIGAGAFLVTKGKSEAGTIIAFMSYFTIIANALISISRIFVNLSKGTASMARIAEVLSEDYELRVENDDDTKPTEEDVPYIEFRHVTFGYGESVILKDVSFTLNRHETLGIIGETGSGKSTILNLLMRFYDADEGDIFLDGQNIKDISTKKLRSMFGVVFQNDFLFADTISENIRFGRDIEKEAIESAAKDAQAHQFISARSDGYDDMLAIKGANLSGGQKQRLLISRALAADPDILVLDDSSSALDYKTDSLLRSAISAHFSHTTTVIVAQRVSSLAHADKILVLSEGSVAACGRHEELLERSPLYEEISRSQMGGAILD